MTAGMEESEGVNTEQVSRPTRDVEELWLQDIFGHFLEMKAVQIQQENIMFNYISINT